MRKMLLGVLCVSSGGVALMLFGAVILCQTMGLTHGKALEREFPMEVPGTPLTILQLTEYTGPFLENPVSDQAVTSAALLVENTGGMYISQGAVVLQQEEGNLVFELRDLPPGAKVLVLEKDGQIRNRTEQIVSYGWVNEEYPEQKRWIEVKTADGGMAVTNTSSHILTVLEITWKCRSQESSTYVGGISYKSVLKDVLPGETRLLYLPESWQGKAQPVKILVYEE